MKMALFDGANTKLHRMMILSGYQMAILPIDLQTLYGQLEKVSKTAVQQQAAHLQSELHNEKEAHRLAARKEAVVETEKTEEGPNINKDAHSHSGGTGQGKKKEGSED